MHNNIMLQPISVWQINFMPRHLDVAPKELGISIRLPMNVVRGRIDKVFDEFAFGCLTSTLATPFVC